MSIPKITYCLWFNKDAEAAAEFYTVVFDQAGDVSVINNPIDTPSGKSGTALTFEFNIYGQRFLILNGGSELKPNPSVSFMLHLDTAEDVEKLWHKLSEGGQALMPLDRYPFSDKYGWIQDKYGVSWQLILPKQKAPQKLMPALLFVNDVCGKAEEAIQFYVSAFQNTKTATLARYPAGMAPDKEGTLMYADFMLEDQWFVAMDSAHAHQFQFNEAISFVVHCETQEEIDDYWAKLTAGGKEIQCGWLRDKYGVTWQVAPDTLMRILRGTDQARSKRAMQAMMQMVKLDISGIEGA